MRTRYLVILAAALALGLVALEFRRPPAPPNAHPPDAVAESARNPSTWMDVSGEAGSSLPVARVPAEMVPAERLQVPEVPDTQLVIPPPVVELPPAAETAALAATDTHAEIENRSEEKAPEPALIPPVLLKAAWVDYPREALKRKAEARVEVRILVAENGGVSDVELVESGVDSALARAAVASARAMRFRPATRGGQPVSVWYNYRFDFSLPRPG